jgi:hypothetical protein
MILKFRDDQQWSKMEDLLHVRLEPEHVERVKCSSFYPFKSSTEAIQVKKVRNQDEVKKMMQHEAYI